MRSVCIILLFLFSTQLFSQKSVFSIDTTTKKYFKLANPGKRTIAINTDLIKTALYGMPNVGVMISPKKRWIIDVTLGKSFNTNSIVKTEFPAAIRGDYETRDYKKDHHSVGCYFNVGSLGLTYSAYVGVGYSIFNLYSTFYSYNIYTPPMDPVDWKQRSIYFTIGSQLPVYSNLQLGWQAGIGNSKFTITGPHDPNDFFNIGLYSNGLYGYGKLILQYLIY